MHPSIQMNNVLYYYFPSSSRFQAPGRLIEFLFRDLLQLIIIINCYSYYYYFQNDVLTHVIIQNRIMYIILPLISIYKYIFVSLQLYNQNIPSVNIYKDIR